MNESIINPIFYDDFSFTIYSFPMAGQFPQFQNLFPNFEKSLGLTLLPQSIDPSPRFDFTVDHQVPLFHELVAKTSATTAILDIEMITNNGFGSNYRSYHQLTYYHSGKKQDLPFNNLLPVEKITDLIVHRLLTDGIKTLWLVHYNVFGLSDPFDVLHEPLTQAGINVILINKRTPMCGD